MSSTTVESKDGQIVVFDPANMMPFMNGLDEKIQHISSLMTQAEATLSQLSILQPTQRETLDGLERQTIRMEEELNERIILLREEIARWDTGQCEFELDLEGQINTRQLQIEELKVQKTDLEHQLASTRASLEQAKRQYKERKLVIKSQKKEIDKLSSSVNELKSILNQCNIRLREGMTMLLLKHLPGRQRDLSISEISDTSSSHQIDDKTDEDDFVTHDLTLEQGE